MRRVRAPGSRGSGVSRRSRPVLAAVTFSVTASVTVLGLIALGTAAGAAVAAEPASTNPAPPQAPPTSFPVQPPVSTAGGVITRSAHVAFEGCNARHITLRVTIAKDPFLIGQAVTYQVTVTNSGATPCGRSQTSIPSLRRALTVGPCGELSGVVVNAAGLDVYPGKEIFGCPLFWGVHLGAHATLKAERTWTGYQALSGGPQGTVQWQKAPPGRYSVIVDNAVSVPFELAGAPTVPSLPTPLPTPLPNLPRTGVPTPLPPGPSRSHPTTPNAPLPTPTTPSIRTPNLPTPTTPTTNVG